MKLHQLIGKWAIRTKNIRSNYQYTNYAIWIGGVGKTHFSYQTQDDDEYRIELLAPYNDNNWDSVENVNASIEEDLEKYLSEGREETLSYRLEKMLNEQDEELFGCTICNTLIKGNQIGYSKKDLYIENIVCKNCLK